MSSNSLAIRYRPKTFDEVVGQDKAVAVLKGLIKSRNTSRGILLSGPMGVGKTTLARIVAHALNCENYDTAAFKACGQCDYCQAVAQVEKGTYPGVQEMNFSETRGIDTVRALIDGLEYESITKTRVVILDEMHNMTQQAANALLKCLEEPPDNTLFILLTTEYEKILPTIRGRCLQVFLTRVEPETLFQKLQVICDHEKRQVPPYALKYIATLSGGILRDAVTALESLFCLQDSNPESDLSDQKFLERMFATKETRTATLVDFLVTGVYGCKFSLALVALRRLLRDPGVNMKLFFERCYELHLQTFHLIVDPQQRQEELFSDVYGDWYASLKDALTAKRMFLVLDSGEEILNLLFELTERMKAYDADVERLTTAYTVKMVKSVLKSRAEAYTPASPIHKLLAPTPEVK